MAKYQQFLSKIGSNRDRAALRGIFSMFLTDDDPPGVKLSGAARIDLSNVNIAAANIDGGLMKGGTAASPIVESTANMKFLSFYFQNGATSGDSRGIYNRLYITGAGGGGESLRSFTTITDVAAANAHGAHISLNFGSSGTVTGEGIAVRATLQLANVALTSNVTLSAVYAEIWSDGSTTDPGGSTKLSSFLVGNNGNATGAADVDDDCALFDFRGWTVANGNMISTDTSPTTCPNITHSIRCRLPDGTAAYLYLGAAEVST